MNRSQQLSAFLFRLRNRHFLLADFIIVVIMPTIALILRFDGIEDIIPYFTPLLISTAAILIINLYIFYWGKLYSRFWGYASVEELTHITMLCLCATGVQTVVLNFILRPLGLLGVVYPTSLPIVAGLLTLLAVGGIRFSVRAAAVVLQHQTPKSMYQPVVVAGAGSAGVLIVQEMQNNPQLAMWPVAFVDDAPEKQGLRIRGIPVLGSCKEIQKVTHQVSANLVVIAMPTASGKKIREIVSACELAGVQPRTMPGIYEMLDSRVSLKQLREVRIEDLLRREPINTDTQAVGELIRGKRVLITGGGGSIGSELCRQVLRFEPSSIIILGHGENSVFEIENELRWTRDRDINHGGRANGHRNARTEIIAVIADIRVGERIYQVFDELRPEVVFHTAAHKHVPLMESNPGEAITNNILGTQNLLLASRRIGVDHFVMISTDKAVNPTNVMGASKRIAELLVHQEAERTGKPYVAVRFGNVLGSRGSVVLTFQRQIAAGGPVTVTNPDMKRFFMTIPEAVQLVLQSATLGRGGEVFMLDMGEPVKIVDLATDLIKLSGLELGRDIDIEISGSRPGEKLFEELFIKGEEYARTRHEKIFIAANASSPVPSNLTQEIEALAESARGTSRPQMIRCLKSLVPEFHQPEEVIESVEPRRDQRTWPKLELEPASTIQS